MSSLPSNDPSQPKRTVKQKENPDGTLTARPIKKTKGEIAAAATANSSTKSKNNNKRKKRKTKTKTKTTQKAQVSSPPSPPEITLFASSPTHSTPSTTPSAHSAPKPPKAKTRTSTVVILTEDEAMVTAGIDEVIEIDVNGKERSRQPVHRAPTPSSCSESSKSDEDGHSGSESGSDGSEDEETDEAQLGKYYISPSSL
jgi:hypothetical protein